MEFHEAHFLIMDIILHFFLLILKLYRHLGNSPAHISQSRDYIHLKYIVSLLRGLRIIE